MVGERGDHASHVPKENTFFKQNWNEEITFLIVHPILVSMDKFRRQSCSGIFLSFLSKEKIKIAVVCKDKKKQN